MTSCAVWGLSMPVFLLPVVVVIIVDFVAQCKQFCSSLLKYSGVRSMIK